jgi:hypothetical protein
MALDNNLVTSSLLKKPKTPYIIKALISKASYNSLNITFIKGNKDI